MWQARMTKHPDVMTKHYDVIMPLDVTICSSVIHVTSTLSLRTQGCFYATSQANQAIFSSQKVSVAIIAFAQTTSFLMHAVNATFFGFPLSTNLV